VRELSLSASGNALRFEEASEIALVQKLTQFLYLCVVVVF